MEVHEVQAVSVIEIPEAYDACALLSSLPSPLSEEPGLCQFLWECLFALGTSWDHRLRNQLWRVRNTNRRHCIGVGARTWELWGDHPAGTPHTGLNLAWDKHFSPARKQSKSTSHLTRSRDKSNLGAGDQYTLQKLLVLFLSGWTEFCLCNHGESLCNLA